MQTKGEVAAAIQDLLYAQVKHEMERTQSVGDSVGLGDRQEMSHPVRGTRGNKGGKKLLSAACCQTSLQHYKQNGEESLEWHSMRVLIPATPSCPTYIGAFEVTGGKLPDVVPSVPSSLCRTPCLAAAGATDAIDINPQGSMHICLCCPEALLLVCGRFMCYHFIIS